MASKFNITSTAATILALTQYGYFSEPKSRVAKQVDLCGVSFLSFTIFKEAMEIYFKIFSQLLSNQRGRGFSAWC